MGRKKSKDRAKTGQRQEAQGPDTQQKDVDMAEDAGQQVEQSTPLPKRHCDLPTPGRGAEARDLKEVEDSVFELRSRLVDAERRLAQAEVEQKGMQGSIVALEETVRKQGVEIATLKAKLETSIAHRSEREDLLAHQWGELGSMLKQVEETRQKQAEMEKQFADMRLSVQTMRDAAKAAAEPGASGSRSYAAAVGASGSGVRVNQQQPQRAGGPIGFKLTGADGDLLARGGRPAVEALMAALNTQHVSYCNWRVVRSPARDGREEKKMVFFEVPGASDVARILEHAGRAELRTELKNRKWWLDPLFSEEEMRNRKALYEKYGAAIREAQQKAKQQRGLWVRWSDNGTKVFLWNKTTGDRVPVAPLPPPPPRPSTAGA